MYTQVTTKTHTHEISGSYGVEYEDGFLIGCYTVYSGGN